MTKLSLAAAAVLLAITGTAFAQSASSPFNVSVALTANCSVKTAATNVAFGTYAAFRATDLTASANAVFQCTSGVTPTNIQFVTSETSATVSAAGATPTARGVLKGLQYQLSGSYSQTATATAATAGTAGAGGVTSTGDEYTVSIAGTIPSGQGGDDASTTTSHAYTIQINY